MEAKTIAARLEKQYPETNKGTSMSLSPLQEEMVGDVRTPLLVLLGAVAVVLLIACVNVANLLLVRATSREGEVAIRTALGAGRGRFSLSFDIEGRPPKPPGEEDSLRIGFVAPDFLRTLGVPVRRGRGFTEQDREGAPQVVLINEAAARRYFPNEDPLGKRIVLGWSEDGVPKGGEVVGIVGDFKQRALEREVDPELFLPFLQTPMENLSIVVRTTAEPAAVASAARAAVREIDPTLPLYGLQTLDEVVAASASQPKFYLLLLGGFAAIALVLAAVGIYGVIAYGVRQRTQEIGIRMALGATRHRVQRMVVRQGLLLALVGAAAGLLGALFATRGMRSLLYQVSATDPPVYGAVAVVLVLVAALASWLPARRAARTEPQLALRGEV